MDPRMSSRKNRSTAARRKKTVLLLLATARPTCVVDDISDEVLELVLLRLHSPACLIRAASVCKRWRSHRVGFRPALVYSCRRSLDFFPDTASWTIADSRGSLLRSSSPRRGPDDGLIVCEPLTRRYQMAAVPTSEMRRRGILGAFLADGDELAVAGGRIGMSSTQATGSTACCTLYKQNPPSFAELLNPPPIKFLPCRLLILD
uniref:F-box domain-containing protein n=1 Tax=Oryza meridionalis TaxID=40149 RepID=A0A0E0D1I8_9ORYZ